MIKDVFSDGWKLGLANPAFSLDEYEEIQNQALFGETLYVVLLK